MKRSKKTLIAVLFTITLSIGVFTAIFFYSSYKKEQAAVHQELITTIKKGTNTVDQPYIEKYDKQKFENRKLSDDAVKKLSTKEAQTRKKEIVRLITRAKKNQLAYTKSLLEDQIYDLKSISWLAYIPSDLKDQTKKKYEAAEAYLDSKSPSEIVSTVDNLRAYNMNIVKNNINSLSQNRLNNLIKECDELGKNEYCKQDIKKTSDDYITVAKKAIKDNDNYTYLDSHYTQLSNHKENMTSSIKEEKELQEKNKKEEAKKKAAEKEQRDRTDPTTYKNTPSFEMLSRNPEKYNGSTKDTITKVKFSGRVLQVQSLEGTNINKLRLAVNNDIDKVITVDYDSQQTKKGRILDDDYITVYGYFSGLYSYTSIMGAKITVPSVFSIMIDQ